MSKRKKEQLAPVAPRRRFRTQATRTRRWFWPLIAAALLAVVAIYHQVPSFAFTDWDDTEYISENALLKGLSGPQVATEFSRYVMGNYHPITMLSYSAEIALFGKSPGAMHVTNLLLHLLNVVLVALFLRKLTKHHLLSALVALLWAVHPMRVESVAWLSARKDLLMLCFGLLMLLAYLQWRERERPVWYLLAFAAFLFSGLSKAMAVSFVPCLLLIDLAQGRSLKAWKPWTEKIPFAAAALIIGVVAVLAQRSVSTIGNVDLSAADRFWTGGANLVIYIVQQLVPIDLNARYAYPLTNGHLPAHYPALAMIGLAVLALYAWRSSRRTWFIFGIGFLLLHLLPVLQWLPVGQAIRADRYTYAAGIGWSLAIGYVLILLSNKIREARTYLPLLLGALLALPRSALLRGLHGPRHQLGPRGRPEERLGGLRQGRPPAPPERLQALFRARHVPLPAQGLPRSHAGPAEDLPARAFASRSGPQHALCADETGSLPGSDRQRHGRPPTGHRLHRSAEHPRQLPAAKRALPGSANGHRPVLGEAGGLRRDLVLESLGSAPSGR
ncbi:MAG: glycosyltransferase family 39 protein [Flavobacteriales bacterium]|nr:glycosyltransferase family 39 protein [Flavobacteriales bacterium]